MSVLIVTTDDCEIIFVVRHFNSLGSIFNYFRLASKPSLARGRNMNDLSDLDKQIEQLRRCEVIKENDVKSLCAKAREILGKELCLTCQAKLYCVQWRRATSRGSTPPSPSVEIFTASSTT